LLNVTPGQIWKVRPSGKEAFRWVRVVNVILDAVVLEFLDRSEVPDPEKTFAADRSEMLLTASVYQFVAEAPRSHSIYRHRQRRQARLSVRRDRKKLSNQSR
jgi:hypothetical protein